MNIEKKAVKLPHFVTIENLSNDDVSALIEMRRNFKTNPVDLHILPRISSYFHAT